MRWRLQTKEGRAVYGLRKSTVEPTFGIQKEVMGYRQFLVLSFKAVSAEWDLVCISFNLKRMFTLAVEEMEKWLIWMHLPAACKAFLALFWHLCRGLMPVQAVYVEA